jgi:hypothetical protein
VRSLNWLLLIPLLYSPAYAVDYRWTLGFAQGTSEAIIRNDNDSSVNIYCPSGQSDTTPGMFIHVNKIRPRAREQITVQIIVDGKNHTFYLQESQFQASGRANAESLHSLVNSLAGSKGRSFVVEFPNFGMSERFSLLDARRALGTGRNAILSGC